MDDDDMFAGMSSDHGETFAEEETETVENDEDIEQSF